MVAGRGSDVHVFAAEIVLAVITCTAMAWPFVEPSRCTTADRFCRYQPHAQVEE